MRTQRVSFPNTQGQMLSAKIELPIDQHPHNCAIFAHCFTCSKNLNAIRFISQALTQEGIAVLRFDFTGLGDSEGDFADTSFSSNIEDLIAAAEFMSKEYESPSLLIGHSLGGAAVLLAKHQIPSVKAIATIGAPYEPAHVSHLLQSGVEEIKEKGIAEVNIGGRPFTVKKKFLEDLEQLSSSHSVINNLNTGLLVIHSPQDTTVEIENATKIYKAAQHPRSFLSIDGADHLLSHSEDARYVGEAIAVWAKRYLVIPKEEKLSTQAQAVVRLEHEDGYTAQMKTGSHHLLADEPISVGGNDFGPSPYDYLLLALGSCTVMTMKMYANRKEWDLQEVVVHLSHQKIHAKDCADCETEKGKIDEIERVIKIEGNLDQEQTNKLMEIADKCPVHRTLHHEVKVRTIQKT